MEFKFFEYIFSNDLNIFYDYLNKNNINYKTKRNKINFEIHNNCCKVPIEIVASYKDNKITRIELYCQPISFNNRKKIEEEMNSNYRLLEKNLDTSTSYYEANNYDIKMINPEHIWIDVQFERIIENKRLEEENHHKKISIFTIFGVILSVLFIFLYFKFKDKFILNMLTAVIASLYAMFQFYCIYLKDTYKSKGTKIAICIVIPFIYIFCLILISLLFVIRSEILIDSFGSVNILDVLFVIIYLSPSFHILLLVVALLGYL